VDEQVSITVVEVVRHMPADVRDSYAQDAARPENTLDLSQESPHFLAIQVLDHVR